MKLSRVLFYRQLCLSFTLFLLILGMMTGQVSAQDFESPFGKVIPPSPTIANLMQFEEMPIDYHTGQANISIPLFSKQVHKDLNISLGLAYNTQGVKINSQSGWTGTGWSFNGIWSVARTVKGLPDEMNSGPRKGIYHSDNDMLNFSNLTGADREQFIWDAVGSSENQFDVEFDLYQFSFPNGSGRFIITKDIVSGALIPKLISREQNVKIDITYNSVTYVISQFVITDASGLKHTFDQIETTNYQPFTGIIRQGSSIGEVAATQVAQQYSYNSAWNLSSVVTSNQISLLSISYAPYASSFSTSVSYTSNTILNTNIGVDERLLSPYNQGILKPKKIVNYVVNTITTNKPSSIHFIQDGTRLDIDISFGHPETGGAIFNGIKVIRQAGTVYIRYELDYEILNGRLWLDGVNETAGSTVHRHELEYYKANELPPFNSAQDDWGYNKSSTPLVSNPDLPMVFNPDNILKGLLKSITFPTGGKKEFLFEHHTFSYGAGGTLTSEMLIGNPENLIQRRTDLTFQANNSQQVSYGTFYTHLSPLAISHEHRVTVELDLNIIEITSGVGILGNTDGNPLSSMALVFKDGSTEVSRVWLDGDIENVIIPAGATGNIGISLESLNSGEHELSGTIRVHYEEQAPILKQYLYGGGVRIKEVRFYENASADPLVDPPARKWEYSYEDAQDPLKSSGAVDGIFGSLTSKYKLMTKEFLFTDAEQCGDFIPNIIRYYIETQNPSVQTTKGGYVAYKTVTVRESGNGKSVFTYTTAQDYPNSVSVFAYPFFPPEDLDYKRGLLLSQEVYDEQGRILSKTSNNYLFDEVILASEIKVIPSVSCEYLRFFPTYTSYANGDPFDELIPMNCFDKPAILEEDIYNCGDFPHFANEVTITSGWAQLVSSIEMQYTYDASGNAQVFSKQQDITYNSANYQPNQITHTIRQNSTLQDTYRQDIYYPVGSYPTTLYTAAENTSITRLVELNKISSPVLTEEYKNGTLLSRIKNTYFEFSPNLVELQKVWTARSASAVDLEERIEYVSYTPLGNIQEVKKTGDIFTTYFWGYGGTLPVAKIHGASKSEVDAAVSLNSVLINAPGNENTLRTELAKIRNAAGLQEAFVETYTYNRLQGMTSATDPNGKTNYYYYDPFGRLKYIKDQDGYIVKTYEYHYASEGTE